MPVLAGRTREQIRQSIGYNTVGTRFIVSTTTRAGPAHLLYDRNRLFGGDDNFNGWWAYATSGANDGTVRRANNFTQGTVGTSMPGSHELELQPGYDAVIPNAMTYELWSPEFPPLMVEEFINQAIMETLGRAYDPEEDESLHTGHDIARYAIPTALSAISKVYFREKVTMREVHACDRLFDQTTDADFTQANDDEDYKRGGQSLRITVAAAASAGDFVTDSITSIDLSGYTHIEGWIKSTVALSAADWVIRLDNGTVQGDATDLEILSVPAASADTWTRFRIALANPRLDTAIISVGFEMNVDVGAHAVWFDDIQAVVPATAVYREVHRTGWWTDPEAGELVFTDAARAAIGYSALRLVGGGAPVLLTADATVSEVSAWWIICRATELVFQTAAPSYGQGDKFQAQAVLWGERAKKAYKGLNRLRGARKSA